MAQQVLTLVKKRNTCRKIFQQNLPQAQQHLVPFCGKNFKTSGKACKKTQNLVGHLDITSWNLSAPVVWIYTKAVISHPNMDCPCQDLTTGLIRHQPRNTSVKNSSNGLNFTKKRAKNGNFFSQRTGNKRAKLKNLIQKNGRF